MKLFSYEYHKTSLMTSQNWFGQWPGANNVDQGHGATMSVTPCRGSRRHMPGRNQLKLLRLRVRLVTLPASNHCRRKDKRGWANNETDRSDGEEWLSIIHETQSWDTIQ